jgi:F-type H+/Na+-transporting ATPase subunit alpha
MKFKVDEIASVITEEIEQYRSEIDLAEVGRVLEVGDGIARVYGLTNAMASELVAVRQRRDRPGVQPRGDSVGVVILGDYLEIKEGDEVRRTGELLGALRRGVIGRVVDPLGRPLDGKGVIETPHRRPLEFKAPGIAERQPVNEPLQTGIKAIDSMIPIGRGQRELIIGDRKTGKTAIAIDTIINQKGTGVICVYVAIGQKESTVASVVEKLREPGRWTTPSSSRPAPPTRRRCSTSPPTPGCAMAEYFMYEQGKATLCVYDDLSKQAPPTGSSRCCCAGRRAARRTRATSSTSTRACSSARQAARRVRVVPKDTPEDSTDRSLVVKHPQGLEAPRAGRPTTSPRPLPPADGKRAAAWLASLPDADEATASTASRTPAAR